MKKIEDLLENSTLLSERRVNGRNSPNRLVNERLKTRSEEEEHPKFLIQEKMIRESSRYHYLVGMLSDGSKEWKGTLTSR